MPMFNDAGTRTPAGISVAVAGFSQYLRIFDVSRSQFPVPRFRS